LKYFEEFQPSGYTFRERIGEPNAFDAGIGNIAIWFSELEEIVSKTLLQLLVLIPPYGRIVTSELSFKNKVDMMASLVRQRLPSTRFNVGDDPPVEVLDELVKILFQAEELHNRIMHSSWVVTRLKGDRWTRVKLTAKASHGLSEQSEEMGPDELLDIADFIVNVGQNVEEFFLVMETGSPSEDISRGLAYSEKGQHDQAISDFNKALEINPRNAEAYINRGLAYSEIGENDKAWGDVHKAQDLGFKIHPGFLKALRKASGRQK